MPALGELEILLLEHVRGHMAKIEPLPSDYRAAGVGSEDDEDQERFENLQNDVEQDLR